MELSEELLALLAADDSPGPSSDHEETSILDTSDLLDELLEEDTAEDSPTNSGSTPGISHPTSVNDSPSLSDFMPVNVMSLQSIRNYIQKKDPVQLKDHCKRLQHRPIKPYNVELYKQVLTIGNGKGVRRFKCALCEFTAKQKGGVLQHLRKHTHEKPYSCSLCDFKGVQQNHLDEHFKRIHIEKRVLKCNKCDFETILNASLKEHKRLEHGKLDKQMSADRLGEKLLKCEHCTFSTLYKTGLTRHVRSRHKSLSASRQFGKELLKCEKCDFTTSYRNYLDRHVTKSHKKIVAKRTPSQAFKCQMCSFRTLHRRGLARHVTVAHKRCSKPSENPSETSLNVEESQLTPEATAEELGEKLLECKHCNFTTMYAKYFAFHITKSHKDVLLRLSPGSKGASSQQLSLKRRINYTLKCKQCNFRTRWKASLTRHAKLHKPKNILMSGQLGDNQFQCGECGFRTSSQQGLALHLMWSHKKNIPANYHRCEQCSFSSPNPRAVEKHMVNQHPNEETLECEECDLKTTSAAGLARHVSAIHKSCSKPSEDSMTTLITSMKEPNKKLDMSKSEQLGENNFQCEECGLKMASKHGLSVHLGMSHKPDVPANYHRCVQCSFSSLDPRALDKHMVNQHPNEAPLGSKLCDSKTISKAGLAHRVTKLHKTKIKKNIPERMPAQKLIVRPKTVKCKMCDFRTLHKRALVRHITMAHKGCSKASEDPGTSLKVKVNASVKKPPTVENGKLKVSKSGQLDKNLYHCGECSFKTSFKTGITRHLTTSHKQDVPANYHRCEQCSFSSPNRHALDKHMVNQHPNEKTLECEECDFKTMSKRGLSHHVAIVHVN